MVELKFNSGDEVKLSLAKKEVQGIILESSDSGIVLLKLENGYNIGISKENILGYKGVRKYREEEVEGFSLPKEGKGKKNIGLVVTGGTIASKLDSKTGGVKHLVSIEEFSKFYPELFEKVNVKKIDMPFMLATESMNSEHWIKIAESVEKMIDDKNIDGVIVTHGTDFLHYTASALSFMLKDLGKPVVLTYSQRSIDRASSDANLNLVCSAEMAISDCAEVMIVGHAGINDNFCYAHRGTKVRKMHTSRRDAFQSINSSPIAKVWSDKIEFVSEYRRRDEKRKVVLDKSFEDKIALIKFYPGQSVDILDYYSHKYKGVIIEVSGLGHLPVSESDRNWIPTLKRLIKSGFVICAAPQTIYGRLNPRVYSNGRELLEAGVIFLEDMLPETALVKLGFCLGHHGWKGKIKDKMLENISGEISESIGVDKMSLD